MDEAAVVAAGAAALGTELTAVEGLGGSDRSLVVRARSDTGSYVLKAPLRAGSAREPAALRVLAGVPGVARLVAESADPPVLVLADLGTGPSLADLLLGTDPAAAQDALDAWADTLGAVQAASTGLRDAFEAELAALSPLGPLPADRSADELAGTAAELAGLLPRLGVTPSAAALDELRTALPGGPAALTPGDVCPDNTVLTPAGPVLIDLEQAEFRPVAWDAAYLQVPWPTCWCSWALPDEVAARALDRWRVRVDPPAGFDAELDRAVVAWTFVSLNWFLPGILAGEGPPPDARPRPTRNAAVQHRLARLPGSGPLADLGAEVLTALRHRYGDHPLQVAPAFRSGPVTVAG